MKKAALLGIYDYVNVWPIYHDFLFGTAPNDVELISEKPSVLNHYFQAGVLDASCLSSIEYPRLQSMTKIIPHLALSTRGPAKSVLLFSKTSLEGLHHQKIYVTKASATSVALLQVLLHLQKIDAQLFATDDPIQALDQDGSAALLIGDPALKAATQSSMTVYDLGELWWQQTQKPFVWALWGIRNDTPQDEAKLSKILTDSRNHGVSNLTFVAQAAAYKLGLSPITMENYFKNFSYELNAEEIEGLLLFYKHASRLGLVPSCNEIHYALSPTLNPIRS